MIPAGEFTKPDARNARELVRQIVAALHPRKRENLIAEASDVYTFLDAALAAAPENAPVPTAAD